MKKHFLPGLLATCILFFFNGCSKLGEPTDDGDHEIDHSDNVFPVLVVNKPVNNQVYKQSDTVFVEGTVTDNKTMYKGRIRITDDSNGFVMKEEFYETHIMQTINFNFFYKANVVTATDYTISLEFEDHGLNKVYGNFKVRVNP